jgi:long-chain fatty acid transport protein
MAFVGNRIDLGVSFFNPNREYTVRGNPDPPPAFGLKPGTVESDSEWFIIPALGANWMMNENSSLGLSIYGNGGMNTDYDEKTFGHSPTGVDLMQLFVVPTYALKFHPKHSIGISPIFAYQRFEAQGLKNFAFFSRDSDNLTNNVHDNSYGYGGRLGYLGEVLPGLFLGASYQTQIYMSELDKYEGLFAEKGDFDIPQNWSAGLAYHATPELIFVFDVQEIYYSDIKAVHNPLTTTNLKPGSLGKDNGAGFGWDDMTIYKVGVQWQSSPDWTWRAGYSYGKQPIPDSEMLFNILAPGVIEEHATVGLTMKIGNNKELDFALMRAFPHDVRGKNVLDPNQTIELKMDQWEISAGYSYKF